MNSWLRQRIGGPSSLARWEAIRLALLVAIASAFFVYEYHHIGGSLWWK